MPYVMLMGLRKKAKQREEQREAMEAEAGIVAGNAGSARRKSAQTPRGRGGGGRGGGGSRGGGSDRGGSGSRCVLFVLSCFHGLEKLKHVNSSWLEFYSKREAH